MGANSVPAIPGRPTYDMGWPASFSAIWPNTHTADGPDLQYAAWPMHWYYVLASHLLKGMAHI